MEFNNDPPPPVDNCEPGGLEESENRDNGNIYSRSYLTERANRARALGFVLPDDLLVAPVEQNLQPRVNERAIHHAPAVALVEQNLQPRVNQRTIHHVPAVALVEQNLQPRGVQPAVNSCIPLAPVEQNLQPQPEQIDVVVLDSEDEDDVYYLNDDEDEEDEEDDDDEEDRVFEHTNSLRIAHGRSPLNGSGSAQIADNQQPADKRRRTDSQPPANIRDNNVVGTGSSMQELVASPPHPPQASTSVCPTCMGPIGASSSKAPVQSVAPPPSPPPPPPPPPPSPPTFNCPICMGPLVDPVVPICGHMFCNDCLRTSLAVQPMCPLCRFKIPSHREIIPIYFPTDD